MLLGSKAHALALHFFLDLDDQAREEENVLVDAPIGRCRTFD